MSETQKATPYWSLMRRTRQEGIVRLPDGCEVVAPGQVPSWMEKNASVHFDGDEIYDFRYERPGEVTQGKNRVPLYRNTLEDK